MKKLKEIWRYYFDKKIRALKHLKRAMYVLDSNGDLTGMCDAITHINLISENEYYIISSLIDIYAEEENKDSSTYFFERGELQPRLDWCDMVINKIKTK